MAEQRVPSHISAIAALMRVDLTTVEVTRAFRAAGIRSVLLKGPSIARWLYDTKDSRPYADSDLMVSPDDLDAAEGVLEDLGFRPSVQQRGRDRKFRPQHALPWEMPSRRAVVDLHQTIGQVNADPRTVWRVLSDETDELVLHGLPIEVLNEPARALHIAVHAAHHSVASPPSALEDLRRAVAALPAEGWRHAASLAYQIGGAEELARGLALVDEGIRLARTLNLPRPRPADEILRRRGTPPLARSVNWILEADSSRGKLGRTKEAAKAAFPSPREMRDWSGLARRGRAGLALAYLWRPFWILARLPAAWLAIRRARKDEAVGR